MSGISDLTDLGTLQIERQDDGVCRITMSRPDVFNAFDETMVGELGRAFDGAAADRAVRVIVLAGAGKHFSAGADLKWMERASRADREWNLADARRFAAVLHRIATCPKPTVARVQGAALGGGVGLICACDIALAADNASFAVSEARFGILPSVIGPYLYNAVGRRQAIRLALSASRIRAGDALAMGMVHGLVPPEELDSAVGTLVRDLLMGGPEAQREIKALFGGLMQGEVTEEVREHTARTISRVRGTDEAKEGFRAFFEKRKADWIP